MTRPQYCNFCLCAARCYCPSISHLRPNLQAIITLRLYDYNKRHPTWDESGHRWRGYADIDLAITLPSFLGFGRSSSQTCFGRRVRARTVVVHRSARVLLALYSTIHAQRPRSSYVCTANLAIGDTSPRLLYSPVRILAAAADRSFELLVHMPGLERPADLHFECDGLKS